MSRYYGNEDADSAKSDEYGYGEDSFDEKMSYAAYSYNTNRQQHHHHHHHHQQEPYDQQPQQQYPHLKQHSNHYQQPLHHHGAKATGQVQPGESNKLANFLEKSYSILKQLRTNPAACKMFYSLNEAALAAIFPFLAIFFKQIGMSASKTGALIGVRALFQFLFIQLWNRATDKWKAWKCILLMSLLGWIICTICIPLASPAPDSCVVHNGSWPYLYSIDSPEKEEAAIALPYTELRRGKRSIKEDALEEALRMLEYKRQLMKSRKKRNNGRAFDYNFLFFTSSTTSTTTTTIQPPFYHIGMEEHFEEGIPHDEHEHDHLYDHEEMEEEHEGENEDEEELEEGDTMRFDVVVHPEFPDYNIESPSEYYVDLYDTDHFDNHFVETTPMTTTETTTTTTTTTSTTTTTTTAMPPRIKPFLGANYKPRQRPQKGKFTPTTSYFTSQSIAQPFTSESFYILPSSFSQSVEILNFYRFRQVPNFGQPHLGISPLRVTNFKYGVSPGPVDVEWPQQPVTDTQQQQGNDLLNPVHSTLVYRSNDVRNSFFLLLFLLTLGEFFNSPVAILSDLSALIASGNDAEIFGRQRIFGSMGSTIVVFFLGVGLDRSTEPHCGSGDPSPDRDYAACFITFTFLACCSVLSAFRLRFDDEGGNDRRSTLFPLLSGSGVLALSEIKDRAVDKVRETLTRKKTQDRENLVEADEMEGGPVGYGFVSKGHCNTGVISDDLDGYQQKSTFNNINSAHLKKNLINEKSFLNGQGVRNSIASVNNPFEQDNLNDVSEFTLSIPWFYVPRGYPGYSSVQHWRVTLAALLPARFSFVLFSIWFSGFASGVSISFLFWHLLELKGNFTLFGLTFVFGQLSCMTAYLFSRSAVIQFGHIKVIYAGLLCCGVRFIYISYLSNPWWVLPVEFFQGLTQAGLWTAACSYVCQAVPSDLKPSCHLVVNAFHGSLGCGLGAIVGGLLIDQYGTVAVFRMFGTFSFLVFLSLFLLNFCYLRPQQRAVDSRWFYDVGSKDVANVNSSSGKLTSVLTNTSTTSGSTTGGVQPSAGSIEGGQRNPFHRPSAAYAHNPYQVYN